MTSSNGNIFRVTGHLCVNFPHKGQWRGALIFSLIYAWINDWVNNRDAGDLRRQHGHYDVIVMVFIPRTGMNISDYCGVRTEPNVVLNCNNSKVIRVERVYFGATPSLKCPPPHNCGTFDVEETERLRVNCNRLPTCTTPANFPLVDCEGQRINSTSVYVTYQCVQGKRISGLLLCEK